METYRSTSRADRGDPHRWNIDLKWSAWTTDESIWEEHAPKTYQMLKDGFDGGYFEESGEPMEIHSAPRKEGRWMTVTITPRADGIHVDVVAADVWDNVNDLLNTLGLDEDEEQRDNDRELLWEILDGEGAMDWRLDGEPGVALDRHFIVPDAEDALAYFLERVDGVESELLQEAERAWEGVERAVAATLREREPPRTGRRRPRGARRPFT